MFNNYVQNLGYYGSQNEILNQALRVQSAQEYYKKMMIGINFGNEKAQRSSNESKVNLYS